MTDKKPKILLVDDEKFIRELIAQKLLSQGYDIVEAATGEEGVKKAKEEKPDFILMDIVMPVMDGYEATRRLKIDLKTKDIPIFGLSNLSRKEDIEKAIQIGMIDYWVTAYHTPNEVVEQINNYFENQTTYKKIYSSEIERSLKVEQKGLISSLKIKESIITLLDLFEGVLVSYLHFWWLSSLKQPFLAIPLIFFLFLLVK